MPTLSECACRFLKLLELIVVEPGSAFKGFLPRILSICMEQIYPIISPVRLTLTVVSFFCCMFRVCVCVCVSPCPILPYCEQTKPLPLSVCLCLSVSIHEHPSPDITSPWSSLQQALKHEVFLLQHYPHTSEVLSPICCRC